MTSLSDLVTGKLDEDLLCGICLNVLEGPTSCCKQGHIFCRICLDDVLAMARPLCPSCRQRISEDSFSRIRYMEKAINELKIRCENGVDSKEDAKKEAKKRKLDTTCTWTGQMQNLQEHLKKCGFQKVKCCHSECRVRRERRSIEAHEASCNHRTIECERCGQDHALSDTKKHDGICPMKLMTCRHGCGEQYARWDKMQHAAQCRHITVECSFPGCQARLKRKDMPTHDVEMSQEHGQLCKETLNGLVEKLAEQEKEIELLRRFNSSSCPPLRTMVAFDLGQNRIHGGFEFENDYLSPEFELGGMRLQLCWKFFSDCPECGSLGIFIVDGSNCTLSIRPKIPRWHTFNWEKFSFPSLHNGKTSWGLVHQMAWCTKSNMEMCKREKQVSMKVLVTMEDYW